VSDHSVRASTAGGLRALVLLGAADPCTAATVAATATETRLANYAFASEIGSGLYEISGQTLFVYTVQPGYRLREAQPRGGRPGIKLILPSTVGFFNFQPEDLLQLEVPKQIGAISLEPGVELDYWLNDAWHLYPYVKAGATFASSAQINALIYGVGIRSDFTFDAWSSAGLWRAELNHASVRYRTDVPSDSFTRLRNGLELRHTFGWPQGTRRAQLGLYGMADIYLDAPSGPASGVSPHTVQFETGLMFGTAPMWRIHRYELPRIGIGYRFAGQLSGWRLVLSEPF
jgi:hypothetical protein